MYELSTKSRFYSLTRIIIDNTLRVSAWHVFKSRRAWTLILRRRYSLIFMEKIVISYFKHYEVFNVRRCICNILLVRQCFLPYFVGIIYTEHFLKINNMLYELLLCRKSRLFSTIFKKQLPTKYRRTFHLLNGKNIFSFSFARYSTAFEIR